MGLEVIFLQYHILYVGSVMTLVTIPYFSVKTIKRQITIKSSGNCNISVVFSESKLPPCSQKETLLPYDLDLRLIHQ